MHRGLIATVFAAAACCGAPGVAAAPEPALTPYTATYAVFRGRVRVGQMEVTLSRTDGGSWLYQSHSRTTGIIAMIRNVRITETTRFRVAGGEIVPHQHVYTLTGDRRDRNFALVFDWMRREVRGIAEGEAVSAELERGMVDRHTVVLATILDVAGGREMPRNLVTVDRARIRELEMRIDGVERLRVDAGEFDTTRVVQQRVDDPDKRIVVWLAPEAGHLPIRVRSEDDDGQTITLALQEYSFD